MWRWAFMVVALVAGCGGGSDGAADGAIDAGAGDGGESLDAQADALALIVPDPPSPPMAPRMTCAAGWRAVMAAGTMVCDPWPATGHATCSGASAHLPGTAGCAAIGS